MDGVHEGEVMRCTSIYKQVMWVVNQGTKQVMWVVNQGTKQVMWVVNQRT